MLLPKPPDSVEKNRKQGGQQDKNGGFGQRIGGYSGYNSPSETPV